MMRLPVISLDLSLLMRAASAAAVLTICVAPAASGQTTNSAHPDASAGATTLPCIQIARELASVTVGPSQGPKLSLAMGRATGCHIAETLGIWDIWISPQDTQGRVVNFSHAGIRQDGCPALAAYMNQLPAPREANPLGRARPIAPVVVGPFSIKDSTGIFRLRSAHDRRATELWLRGMLAAVRGCWRNQDGEEARNLADRFYGAIGL